MGSVCCAVPETDDDWYEVERTLNTLDNVLTRYAEIHSCLVDPVMRMYIVEDFVHTCQSATLLPLWGRVTAFRDALHVVLRSVNEETGRRPANAPVPGCVHSITEWMKCTGS